MLTTAEILKEKGLKVTPQRLAIYTFLRNTCSHPTAEDIYNDVSVANPSISLATVYKTLDSFTKVGLVQELRVINEHSNYDARMQSHAHIVCTHCKKIFDFMGDSLDIISDSVSNESGFDISASHFTFYGICPECKNK